MEQEEIRNIQRKNGKIIVRAMMELEVATFEAIVGKLCEDYNVSCLLRLIDFGITMLHS